mgnify:CR=1 FL=1
MEMPLKGWGKVLDYEKEIAAANHPNIRLLHVEHVTSTQPETDIKIRDNGWQVCSPLTVPEFSATAYFFGREIFEKQNVPVVDSYFLGRDQCRILDKRKGVARNAGLQ